MPLPASAEPPARQHRPPVLLLHGWKDSSRKMEPLARHLRRGGRRVHTLSMVPSWGQVGLETLAGQVRDFAEATFPAGEKFDLVGFSMGGLVARYYLQRLDGLQKVHRFVTISTPHAGSALAWALPNTGGRQMRPGSDFLTDLNRDVASLNSVGFTSIYTPLDLTVLPARSSLVAGAKCQPVWCALHPLMVAQPHCLAAVAQALE